MKKWILGMAIFAVAGCKDKSVEEYQRDKLKQNLSRFEAVSGSYRGIVTSAADGQVIGAFEITLTPDTTVNPPNGGDSSSGSPVLASAFRFLDQTVVSFSNRNGFYDPDSGRYHAEFSVPRAGGAITFSVSGSISGNLFTGELHAAEFPQNGGNFRLEKNGDSLESLLDHARPGERHDDTQSITRTYVGEGFFGPGDFRRNMALVVTDPSHSNVDSFLELFYPETEKDLTVTLRFSESVAATFAGVKWDSQKGILDGIYVGGGTYTAQLQCFRFYFRRTTASFTCSYWTSRSAQIDVTFKPPFQP